MGGVCSAAAATSVERPAKGGASTPGYPDSGGYIPTPEMSITTAHREDLLGVSGGNVDALIQEKRINMSRLINSKPPTDADARLLRVAAASVVFSATEEHFRFFVEAPDAATRLNELSIQMSPASMNFGATAVSLIMDMSQEIRDAGVGIHNTPISSAQLMRVLNLKVLWKKMLEANSVRNYEHPRLGKVPVIQPVLHTCIQWRGAGMGNGTGGEPDPIFKYLLDHGARVNIDNSLGLTTMHAVVEAAERGGASQGDDPNVNLEQTMQLARLLSAAGASPLAKCTPFHGNTNRMKHSGIGLEKMLAEGKPLDAIEACRWWMERYTQGKVSLAAMVELLTELADQERPRGEDGDGLKLTTEDFTPGSLPPGWRDCSTHPLQPQLPSPSWVQAIFNTIWLVSRLTALETPADRRRLLTTLAPSAPFQMPLMTAVPYSTLKELGRMPKRDTSLSDDERGWRGPIPAPMLPDDAIVVFLSHRWLQPGNPDDQKGTKFKQIMEVMELIAAQLGGAEGARKLYLWADYCCIDQCNPFPGVQMLPAYVACCDEFAYVVHPEYDNRAWCRTEQFMHWRLKCHKRKWRLEEGKVVSEPPAPCPDPASGELYSEEDRVALVNMTALFDDRP